jgi:hypothetical protein
MKIKIFNTFSNKPQDGEAIIQKWLDTFEQRGKVIDIKHVCHEFVDNEHIVQTLFIYEERLGPLMK